MKSSLVYGLMGASLLADAHPSAKPKPGSIVELKTNLAKSSRIKTSSQYVHHKSVKADKSLKLLKRGTYVETATELVKKVLPNAEFRLKKDHYIGKNGIAHVYFRQTVHGIDVGNGDFNVNIAPDGSILSYGHSFFTGKQPTVNPLQKRSFGGAEKAIQGVMKSLGLPLSGQAIAEPLEDLEAYVLKGISGVVSEPTARLAYLIKPDGDLALSWKVETNMGRSWLHSYVDAITGKEVYGTVDWVSDATYKVFPWDVRNPEDGEREVVEDPADESSPFGWHSDGSKNYTITQGNNALALQDYSGGGDYSPESESLEFEYDVDFSESNPDNYKDASVTQLFYTANYYHDLLYELGFTEEAGNFQADNNGKGGEEGDYVILSAQDSDGTDNAWFSTPPDGQNGQMAMFLWTESDPERDCTFEKDVIIHEYTHGLSTRLTGGPSNSDCLAEGEAGGMGEGWGDFYGIANSLKDDWERDTPVTVGAWVFNSENGIRSVPYTSDMEANPNTYETLNGQNEVHDIGETWTTVLWEVLWNLVDKHGRNSGPKPEFQDGVPTDGNFLTQKLVLDAMALQPCNPTFVSARDAILDADEALTGGDNACEIWTAFAKRGVGKDADSDGVTSRTASFDVPEDVC
ncbi:fungalysin metallopeptidase [Poronia punctata]|nr:fungalysin metallopeptidase [Poronia punctata]